jgi:hypothetical protein
MPHLLIKIISFISCITLLVRLYLHYGPYLSLSVYIYFFIKLTLLVIYAIMISYSICGLGCVSLDLHMRVYILSIV